MKLVEEYINDKLVKVSWGEYEGVKDLTLLDLSTLQSLVSTQLQFLISRVMNDDEK